MISVGLNQCRQLVRVALNNPPKFRAIQGRHQVLEGSAIEEIIVLEFPTFEDAAGYHRTEYQSACQSRFQGGDYCRVIFECLPT
jgi:uncharacterized protein (DUF1330 family)